MRRMQLAAKRRSTPPCFVAGRFPEFGAKIGVRNPKPAATNATPKVLRRSKNSIKWLEARAKRIAEQARGEQVSK